MMAMRNTAVMEPELLASQFMETLQKESHKSYSLQQHGYFQPVSLTEIMNMIRIFS
jgi:hypothetical protein